MKRKTQLRINLDLLFRRINARCTGHMADGHLAPVDVTGQGRPNAKIPTAATLVRNGKKKADKVEFGQDLMGLSKKARKKVRTIVLGQGILPPIKTDGLKVIPRLPDEADDKLNQTLIKGAGGLQELMVKRQFDGILDARFGEFVGTVNWAINNMEAKFQPPYVSLSKQLPVLIDRYKTALPQLSAELHKKYPKVPVPVIVQKACELLDEQLSQILFVIKVYTDAAGQYRDGVYGRELRAISFFYETAAMLFKKVDPDNPKNGGIGLDTIIYQVGDVYLARFTNMGLSTIPGSKGPLRAHALQVPFDMLDVLAIMLPLLAHEFRHNLFSDVPGLEEELIAALRDAIVAAAKAKTFVPKTAKTKMGDAEVDTVELLTKLMVDSIGEIDADLGGGVCFSGTGYLYNMILSFPAMLVRGTPIAKAKKLLRTSSVYQLVEQEDGSHALVFEPHPPDYIRIFIVAAALEEIGFKAEAEELRKLADFAVGEVPTHITWTDAEEKVDMEIAIPVEDIKNLAPVVAKALLRTGLKSLGGRSTFDMVNWTPEREAKVQKLVEALMKGTSEIPEKGSFFATYVGAAATIAYWRLVHQGEDPIEAIKKVNANALDMIDKLRKKAESQPAA